MDVMSLRRGIMAAMASGAEVLKGTFTTNDSYNYKIEFGKTFSKYMLLVEMTDGSKSELMASEQSSAKMYAFAATYPAPSVGNTNGANAFLSFRIVPTTSEVSQSSSTPAAIDGSSMTITNNAIGNGANVLYRGYSYNYTLVSLDNV